MSVTTNWHRTTRDRISGPRHRRRPRPDPRVRPRVPVGAVGRHEGETHQTALGVPAPVVPSVAVGARRGAPHRAEARGMTGADVLALAVHAVSRLAIEHPDPDRYDAVWNDAT